MPTSWHCWHRVSLLDAQGSAMAQAVIPRPLTAEALVRSEVSPCEICCGKRGAWAGFSPSACIAPCQYHFIMCLSFIDWQYSLCRLSSLDRWTVCPVVITWSCSVRRLAVGTFRLCILSYQTVEGRAYVCMPQRKLETAAGESWLSSDTALTSVRLTAADKCVDVAFSSCERRI
jgi:hypothetical protein